MSNVSHGMSSADYHALPDFGSSGLKLLQRSPLHYWSAYRDPNRKPRQATPLMRIGTAWHAAIFEPEKFATEYTTGHDANPLTNRAKLLGQLLTGELKPDQLRVMPEGLSKVSKEGKALVAEIEAAGCTPVSEEDFAFVCEWEPKLRGREVLSADTMADIKAMAAAAAAHPASYVLFQQCKGFGETSIFWTDADTGMRCKIRPDYHVPPCELFPYGLIVDGKSIDDASPEAFARNAWNSEHHLQAAIYVDGFQSAYATAKPPPFIWLVQERDAPHATAYYSAGDDLIAYGRKQYKRLLGIAADCERLGIWPGYPTQVQPMALPAWAVKTVQEGLAA